MRPTRLRLLLGVAVVVGVATWGVLRVVAAWRGGYPDITWVTPATLWLLAAALLGTALAARPRLRRKPGAKPLPPLVAARLAALALASSAWGRPWRGRTSASSSPSRVTSTPRTGASGPSTPG